MSKEFSAAMAVGSPCSGSPPARHYTERRSGLLFPPDAGGSGELPGPGEGAVVGELEAGEIALPVVIGDRDDAQGGGVDGERGAAQLPGLALRGERDLDLAVRRGAGDGDVARLEVVDAEQQEVQARLVLAVDAVAAPGVVLGVPGLDHLAAEQEALRIGLLVVPAQAVGEVQREAAALLLAGREAGRDVGLREGGGGRARLDQAAAHPREPGPGVGGGSRGGGGAGGRGGRDRRRRGRGGGAGGERRERDDCREGCDCREGREMGPLALLAMSPWCHEPQEYPRRPGTGRAGAQQRAQQTGGESPSQSRQSRLASVAETCDRTQLSLVNVK